MSDETKIVIILKGENATVGIQRNDCDPALFGTIHGGLPAVLAMVPLMLEKATARWQTNPRYPKAEIPAPPPPAPVTTGTRTVPVTSAQPKTQQAMF